ncbi:hypothetical protein NB545_05680 [Vibrio campbellii]|uniref:hypothetical protein n=1 Tax=Vibrio campbellii TaxID=680 RepID=UPI00215D3F76|nr:hypothetical protein [Vibrio campbellii]MCR9906958.1 hypothetical protein [Vibrio campbellii]
MSCSVTGCIRRYTSQDLDKILGDLQKNPNQPSIYIDEERYHSATNIGNSEQEQLSITCDPSALQPRVFVKDKRDGSSWYEA